MDRFSKRPTLRAPRFDQVRTVPAPPPKGWGRAAPRAPSRRRPLRVGLLVAATGALSFALTFGVMAADRLLAEPTARPGSAIGGAVAEPETVAEPVAVAELVAVAEPETGAEPVAAGQPMAEPVAVAEPVGVAEPVAEPAAVSEPEAAAVAASAREPAPALDPPEAPSGESTPLVERAVWRAYEMLPDLTAADVRAVVDGERARMQQCYTRALTRAGTARDIQLRVTVDIAPDGRVTGAATNGDDVAGLGACLRELATRLRFPPSRAGARVPIPLRFSTRD